MWSLSSVSSWYKYSFIIYWRVEHARTGREENTEKQGYEERRVAKGQGVKDKRDRRAKERPELDQTNNEEEWTRIKVSLTISSSHGRTDVWVWSPASAHPCNGSLVLFWCTCTCRLSRNQTHGGVRQHVNMMNLQGCGLYGNWLCARWLKLDVTVTLRGWISPQLIFIWQTLNRRNIKVLISFWLKMKSHINKK